MNPELRRNLWLELSAHRLIAMPSVLFLVFAFFASRTPGAWTETLSATATAFFVLIVHLWGTYKASEAVTDEVRDRTWDWQRLSALDPWRMAWGKLAGTTAFTWYGGAICMAAIAWASLGDPHARPGALALYLCRLVALGVVLQGAALAASLQASRKSSRIGHRAGLLLVFPIAAAGLFVFRGLEHSDSVAIEWYGHAFDAMRFYTGLSVVLALWAVLAAYREMARGLSVRLLPWAYPAFAVGLAALVAGYAKEPMSSRSTFALAGLLISLALAYYGLFADVTSAMTLRRLALDWRARRWRRLLEDLPLWIPALAMALAFALLCTQILSDGAPLAILPRYASLYPIALLLIAVRDCGIFVFFALATSRRGGPEAVTLLYIVLLSWIIPGLLAIAGMGAVAKLFMPFGAFNGWQAALVTGAHVAIVAGLVAWRWRRWDRAFRGA